MEILSIHVKLCLSKTEGVPLSRITVVSLSAKNLGYQSEWYYPKLLESYWNIGQGSIYIVDQGKSLTLDRYRQSGQKSGLSDKIRVQSGKLRFTNSKCQFSQSNFNPKVGSKNISVSYSSVELKRDQTENKVRRSRFRTLEMQKMHSRSYHIIGGSLKQRTMDQQWNSKEPNSEP